jgi:hypothetical protein
MSKRTRQNARKKTSGVKKLAVWAAALTVVGALIYVISDNAGVPYDERAIAVVDFSSLDNSARKTALQEANRARCPCSCGMNLAQCVATDSTCPLRTENIGKIKAIVAKASQRL